MAYKKDNGNNFNRSNNKGGYRSEERSYGKGGYRSEERSYGKGGYRSSEDRSYNKGGYRSSEDRSYGKGGYRNSEDKPFRKFDKFEDKRGGFRKDDRFDRRADEAKAVAKEREKPVAEPVNQEDELPYIIMGRNAVREAIKSGRSIDKIFVVKEADGSLREILGMARDAKVQIREVEKFKLDEMCLPFGHGGKSGNHQGIVAQVPGVEYCDISDILAVAKERGEKPFIILLDGIEDPHNLGSIIRSAECAGAHGVIIPKRRSASVTAAASKSSAGAVEYMKVARVANLGGAIDRLKDEGLWIAGADMSGAPMGKCDLKGAIGLVIGSEGDGMSKLIREKCDFTVSIPMCGHIDSLNAAVAAAILMFEKKRQDS